MDNLGSGGISADNAYWGELTGLYYIWKNITFDKSAIVGFAHYNKILDISFDDIKSEFSKGKRFIVLKPLKATPHTYPDEIAVLEDVLKKYYPKEYESWTMLYDHQGASKSDSYYWAQMFYARYTDFCDYCSFLFGVLFKVRETIGDVNRPPHHKRYCAFLGERLLTVFLLSKNVDFTTVPLKRNSSTEFLKKAKAMFHIKNGGWIYNIAYTILGRRFGSSSYKFKK